MLVLACGDDGASSEGTTGDTTGPGTTMTTNPSTSDASTGSSTTEAMTESAEESTMGGSVSTSLGEESSSSSSSTSAIEPSSSDDTTTGEDTTDSSSATLITESTFGPGTESDTETPVTSSESGFVTGGECAIGSTGGMGMCDWGIYCEGFTHEMHCDAVECVCFEDGVETNTCPAMDVCDDGTIEEYAAMCCGIGV
jgi:hypothetical protein